jgi:hypothetical protein
LGVIPINVTRVRKSLLLIKEAQLWQDGNDVLIGRIDGGAIMGLKYGIIHFSLGDGDGIMLVIAVIIGGIRV